MKGDGWVRTPGQHVPSHCTWTHASGWVVAHCGHPTALFPWALYDPEGRMILAPNGRAWRHVVDAKQEAARRMQPSQPSLPLEV